MSELAKARANIVLYGIAVDLEQPSAPLAEESDGNQAFVDAGEAAPWENRSLRLGWAEVSSRRSFALGARERIAHSCAAWETMRGGPQEIECLHQVSGFDLEQSQLPGRLRVVRLGQGEPLEKAASLFSERIGPTFCRAAASFTPAAKQIGVLKKDLDVLAAQSVAFRSRLLSRFGPSRVGVSGRWLRDLRCHSGVSERRGESPHSRLLEIGCQRCLDIVLGGVLPR